MQAKVSNEEKIPVTHRICPYVYDALKRYAADNGISIQKSLERIIVTFLDAERESYLEQSRKAFKVNALKKKFTKNKVSAK
jgi:hypothetical protein